MKFKGICLKQDSVSYKLDAWSKDLNTDFTLGNCLTGAVKLSNSADPDKYKYSSYGIGFNSRSEFSWRDESMVKNIIILELIILFLCILMVETKIS